MRALSSMSWAMLLAALLCISLAPYSQRFWRGSAPFSPLVRKSYAPMQHPSYSPPGHGELLQEGEEDESRRMLVGEEHPIPSEVPKRGLLWFHHVPKTGGRSVEVHLQKYLKNPSGQRIPYLELWTRGCKDLDTGAPYFDATWIDQNDESNAKCCQKGLDKIEAWLNSPSPSSPMLIVHHHWACGGLIQLAPVIEHFRSKLEMQGGAMHVSCMLRQPIAQTISHLTFMNHITPLEWEQALLNKANYDNFQVRYLLYNMEQQYSGKSLHDSYKNLGANLVDITGEEKEEWQSVVAKEYPPVSGVTGQHVEATLEYLDNVFDFVGQTERHFEYLDELKAFIGRFADTSGWPSDQTFANVQGAKKKKLRWRGASPALKELLISHTFYDAVLYEVCSAACLLN
ncbi:unnamed protein product [Chrysoparadoxa australica]